MNKIKRLAFFSTAIVEIDNFLPLIDSLRRIRPDLKIEIVSLNFGSAYIDTPFYQKTLGDIKITPVFEYIGIPLYRTILKLFSDILSYQFKKRSMQKNNFVDNFLMRLFEYMVRVIVKSMPRGTANNRLNEIDYWIVSPGIINTFIEDSISSYAGLIEWNDKLYQKVVFFPETFDQFTELPEYFDLPRLPNWKLANKLMSRGDKDKRIRVNSNTKIVDLGSPRYSYYWCKKINDYYGTYKDSKDSKVINVLYLPIKLSPREQWLADEIVRLDREMFSILNSYSNVRILVKPHPRTKNNYADVSKYTAHSDRVEVYEGQFDTAELARRSDICVTGGTSFIPHLLWLGIPVILTDDWAKRLGHTFLLEKHCYKWDDISILLNSVVNDVKIENRVTKKQLNNLFECGVDSNNYADFLDQQLNFL